MNQAIWQPSQTRQARANLTKYLNYLRDNHQLEFANYQALHSWSINNRARFWSSIWNFCDVIGDPGQQILITADRMLDERFFPTATLNFAENLLRRQDHSDAIIFWSEDINSQRLSWQQLYDQVSKLRQALVELGVQPGDRIAAYLANTPQTVTAMLATTSLGAIWCSCSPDFGSDAAIDRFAQIEPSLLFAHQHYYYAGKKFDISHKINAIEDKINSINQVIITPYGNEPVAKYDHNCRAGQWLDWHQLLANYQAQPINFQRFPFHHPLYILFSSGTTGIPKCIVHSAGGTLLQHLKEHQLHCDVKANDRVFYYTTTSWMMWHWLISGLASNAALLLYDGSSTHPDDNQLFKFADAEQATLFGTSARFIDTLAKRQARPAQAHNLTSLRTITSTGSPLSPEHFDYVYQHIKQDVQLSSISGGTDIISCFVLGNPLATVYRGEISCAGLGMAVEIWDENGQPIQQRKGELVCTKAFPSMPVGFWNDAGQHKYQQAYFTQYPGVWAHGDFAELTARQGFIIYGRSDTTLNPGGVRIGSAEIYRQLEKIPQLLDSLVIDQCWQQDRRILLFVKLAGTLKLDEPLRTKIKQQIREGASPRHVPALIFQVDDVPRTHSGKLAETAVKNIIEGFPVNNESALANPHALSTIRQLREQHRELQNDVNEAG